MSDIVYYYYFRVELIFVSKLNKRRPLIAVLVNEPDRSFLSGSLNIIQKELFSADMDVAVFSTLLTRYEETDIENKVFDLINYDHIDGVIVFLKGLNGMDLQEKIGLRLAALDKPVIYMDEFEQDEFNTVYEYDECTRIAVEHIAKVHGVKTAAYVGGHRDREYYQRLRKSFFAQMDKYGITVPENLDFYGNGLDGDYGAIADAMISAGLPEGVLCCSDYAAVSVIGELAKRNVRVPEDIIVIGCCRNEPYESRTLNISSVERDPSVISINAARHMIALVKGTEYDPYEGASAEFYNGFSCGCGSLDIPRLSEAARNESLPYGADGFFSSYNYMQEELISAPDFTDFLWKVDWYTLYLEGLKGMWICLNDNIMHTSTAVTDYTDTMSIPYCRLNGGGSVEEGRSFDRSIMLPELFADRDEPSAYFFVSLHFNNVNFGYMALSFGNTGAVYTGVFEKWLRYVTCAFEKQRRHTIYCDTTLNAQIRDTLTGLLNMRGFKRIMTDEFEKSKGKLLRIISVDVDNLNGINKAYGYSEGDKLLQKVAVILNNSAGDGDICVRVSGDEFIIAGILDPENPADEVPLKLERNLEAYNSSCSAGYGIHFFSSAVTAVFDSTELLDKLPYDAAYQRNMTKDNRNKKRILNAPEPEQEEFDPEERRYVGKMLNDNMLRYQFQPIVDARTGEIFAYEALMRSGGEKKLSPIAILNHAAALGRLADIERLTLTNTLEYLSSHKDDFGEKMLFVNSIPSCILSDEDFDEIYSKYRSAMEQMVIEFTEQTEASSDQLKVIIDRSQKMRFKIAIDDYGTGYSNISNLLTFMPFCVKIDRSLIMNIQSDKRKQHFTRNIIEYAHDNNFNVLAEGVETSEELATVISMGVDLIQGYYTAKPSFELLGCISPDVSEEIIRAYNSSRYTTARKTYFTDNETVSDLKALDLEGYTDIVISSPEYTINGSGGYISELTVLISDNTECTLNLNHVNLRDDHGGSSIVVGKNSRLTLNIAGEVTISGSIYVPEGSGIKIVGGGRLSVTPLSNQKFGIGCDMNHSYGDIGIYLNNRFGVKLAADRCVGIGGGYNASGSVIEIDGGEASVDISGKKVMGIGAMFAVPNVKINGSSIGIRLQCSEGIGIGSFESNIGVSINDSILRIKAEGDIVKGIFGYNGDNSAIDLTDCNLSVKLNGKNVHGIGCNSGLGRLSMKKCFCDVRIEGGYCCAFGGLDKETMIIVDECSGSAYAASASPYIFRAEDDKLRITNSDISLYEGE